MATGSMNDSSLTPCGGTGKAFPPAEEPKATGNKSGSSPTFCGGNSLRLSPQARRGGRLRPSLAWKPVLQGKAWQQPMREQSIDDLGDGQTNNVGIGALDPRDKGPGDALNGVGTGLSVPFIRAEIAL
jgi:hypothetical protein